VNLDEQHRPCARGRKRRRQLLRLFAKQFGLCHWCGCEMQIHAADDAPPPVNTATLEHLFPRNDLRRALYTGHPDVVTKVAACHECNNLRGDMAYEEFAALRRGRGALPDMPQWPWRQDSIDSWHLAIHWLAIANGFKRPSRPLEMYWAESKGAIP
jgi:hypothetical protein